MPETRLTETEPRVSPDGRWLAYVSTESGRAEVYVRPLTGGSTVVVSGDGGAWPYWRRDGHELYYVAADNTMQAVPVTPRARSQWAHRRCCFNCRRLPVVLHTAPSTGSTFLCADGTPRPHRRSPGWWIGLNCWRSP